MAAMSQSSSTPAWMTEMMGLEEETGLTCMVCHEGYKFKVLKHMFGGRVICGWRANAVERVLCSGEGRQGPSRTAPTSEEA